jgi:hypothetical protein
MPKNVDLSKSINREKVIEPSIANNEKNIECPPLLILYLSHDCQMLTAKRMYSMHTVHWCRQHLEASLLKLESAKQETLRVKLPRLLM